MDYTIREGNYEKLGVQKKDDAVIFTFEGEKEENCSILFYGKKAEPVCKILVQILIIPSNSALSKLNPRCTYVML